MSLRYTILHHDQIEEPHYDILFETTPNSPLAAFRSPIWPIEEPTQLTKLKDHRRIYLDYEGDLSDHRGHVYRIATGECQIAISEKTWLLHLLTGIAPQRLTLEHQSNDQWQADQAP